MKIEFDNHGGNIEKESRKLGLSAKNIIDASASLVPFKLPKKLTDYLVHSIKIDRSNFILTEVILMLKIQSQNGMILTLR